MLKNYFELKTQEILLPIQEHYKLTIEIQDNKIRYYSSKIDFKIFFERNFDIYLELYFYIEKEQKHIGLFDTINFYNQIFDDNLSLSGNQVSSNEDIDFVLNSILKNLFIVIPKIDTDNMFLKNCFNYRQAITKKKYDEYVISELTKKADKYWNEKKYQSMLDLYEEHKRTHLDVDNYLSKVLIQKLAYAKKQVEFWH